MIVSRVRQVSSLVSVMVISNEAVGCGRCDEVANGATVLLALHRPSLGHGPRT